MGEPRFSDLVFEPHPITKVGGPSSRWAPSVAAKLEFENGFGVSVIQGPLFYCHGASEYEVAILRNGLLCYDSGLTEDVIGHVSRDEVEAIMRNVARLPKK